MSTVGYIIAAAAGLVGLLVLFVTGVIVIKTGISRGYKDAAEGWEARCRELMVKVSEKDSTIHEMQERHHGELGGLREDLSSARERIAVLEAQRDLSPLREELTLMRSEMIHLLAVAVPPEAAT